MPPFLSLWKAACQRKPLILKGARQVGKTTTLQQFGASEFRSVHYFNFERQKQLHSFFGDDVSPQAIINSLSLFTERKIDLERDLIIFDEIQECPNALTSLKYFCEEKPNAFLVCAGSLLGVKLTEESFPVGKVEIRQLFPLSFSEFLVAINKPELARLVAQPSKTLAQALEDQILGFFTHYCVTGGLPEVVQTYINEENKPPFERMLLVREKQKNLIETYENDMAKHSGKLHSMHIRRVWEEVPRQLSRMNQKFQFKNVIPGKRSFADLAGPLDWLLNAGLLIQSSIVNHAQVPLKSYTEPNQFRLFCFDVGILGALSGFPIQSILDLANENLIFKGHFLENFVAQSLHRLGFTLYSWKSNTSEVEFLIQNEKGEILPIEVKSRTNSKAKSLKVFLERYSEIQEFAILTLVGERKGRHYPIFKLESIVSNWNRSLTETLATFTHE